MTLRLRALLLFLLALVPVAYASEGSPVEHILDLLARSNQDGQFLDNLKPVTHPSLVARGLSHPFMRNGQPSPDLTLTGHQLRPLSAQELEELAGFFDFPIPPTHVLTVEQTRNHPGENEALSLQMPLHLTQATDGFWLVFGTLKQRPAHEPPRQQFTFQEDHQSWRHRWTLQFLPDEAQHLALVVLAPDNSEVARLWTAADSPLRPDRPKLTVNLWPVQDEAAFRQGSGGETSVSYGWSSGPQGGASSFNLLLPPTTCHYQPVTDPKFDNDRLCLATFTGPNGVTYRLEVHRLHPTP